MSEEIKDNASDGSNGDGIYVTKARSTFSSWINGKSTSGNPASVFRQADVIREGYLLKQGLRFKRWTKRYFILRLEERHMTLGYYASKDPLILCSETPIGPGHTLAHVDRKKHPRRIELVCGTKSLILEAEDANSFEQWHIALQEAIRWNHAMVPSKSSEKGYETYGKLAEEQHAREEKSRAEAAKKLREKQRAEEAAAEAAEANKPKYLPATREGMQCFMTSNTKFEIPTYYEYVKTIGSGAYGVVISAKDKRKPGELVAIKNIQRAFDDLTDAKRIVREIKLMRHWNHKCVLGLHDLLEPQALETFEDVYIVSKLMATDLHRVIYSRHALSDEHITFFMYQMLCAMKYVHSANVIHRDLKPSNILVNANCELKVCDFGLARGIEPSESLELTEYVVTRWYRAPEIMLGCMKYEREVDVWSMGCIFAEMLSRKPLFPGQDYIDQLHLIMNALGAPSDDELYFLTNARARKFMNTEFLKRGRQPIKSLGQLFASASPLALDLLTKMLVLDPNKRIKIDEALAHEFFKDIRNPADELTCDKAFDYDFENTTLTKPVLQKLIWDEMRYFHPDPNENKADNSAEVSTITSPNSDGTTAQTSELKESVVTNHDVNNSPSKQQMNDKLQGENVHVSNESTVDEKKEDSQADKNIINEQEPGEPAHELS